MTMLSNRKTKIEKQFNSLVAHLSSVNPNILTLLGSIPPLLFFVFVVSHQYIFAIIAFIGNSFDMLDGMVARRYHKVTAFGAFLDSSLDRISDFFIITAFSFGHIVRWEIAAPLLLCSFLTSYTRSRSETLAKDRNIKFNIGLIERPERLLIILLAFIVYIMLPQTQLWGLNAAELLFAVLVILSAYTVFQRIRYAKDKLST